MTDKHRNACPECGAAITAGSDRCDLCGTSVSDVAATTAAVSGPSGVTGAHSATEAGAGAAPADQPVGLSAARASESAAHLEAAESSGTAAAESGSVLQDLPPSAQPGDNAAAPVARFCHNCGERTQPGARFCISCGVLLVGAAPPAAPAVPRVADRAPERATTTPPDVPGAAAQVQKTGNAMSSQVGLIVGAATVLIVLVYLIAAASRTEEPEPGRLPTPGEVPAELSSAAARRAATLRSEISAESDPTVRHQKQHELVELLSSAGRLDQAADEQVAIAEDVQSADAWARAGNLYFDWMRVREGEEQERFARLAVDAYQRSLAIDSTNLGVRTDLGVTYQYVPESADLAIPEIRAVLEIDPAHRIATYNLGVMLARSEQLEEAIEQFQAVLTLVPAGEPLHEQAREWLDAMQGGGS